MRRFSTCHVLVSTCGWGVRNNLRCGAFDSVRTAFPITFLGLGIDGWGGEVSGGYSNQLHCGSLWSSFSPNSTICLISMNLYLEDCFDPKSELPGLSSVSSITFFEKISCKLLIVFGSSLRASGKFSKLSPAYSSRSSSTSWSPDFDL